MGTVGPSSSRARLLELLPTQARRRASTFVPYRGTAPAMQDMLAGQIDLLIDSPIQSLPQVRAGKIRAYAVFDKDRYPSAPDVPTTDDAGLPGFHMTVWNALWAHERHAARHRCQAQRGGGRGARRSGGAKALAELARRRRRATTDTGSRHAAAADIEKWSPVVKAANIRGG